MPHPTAQELKGFITTVWNYYKENARSFEWREDITPYRIVVSEIMLQQTQADRVVPKFAAFIEQFPSWKDLAEAKPAQVLLAWKGLGYNSRALRLQKLARYVCTLKPLELPSSYETLIELPGIGPNTAGSVLAFAYNIPRPFIETNIRSVYIHHFFKNTDRAIDDLEILPIIEQTLDMENPRDWYYALMDYGVFLKKTYKNPSRKSQHHVKQSAFKGSRRELRAALLHHIALSPNHSRSLITLKKFAQKFPQYSPQIFDTIITALIREGAIIAHKNSYSIPS